MTTSEPLAVPVVQASSSSATSARGWIVSPYFDLLLVIGAPVVGFVVMFGATRAPYAAALVTALAFLVGIPHYLSSFVFFLGDDQRAHYLQNGVAYIGGPLAILAGVAILRGSGTYEFVVLAVIYLWNIWHVAMQSSGVLSLYRFLAGARPDRFLTRGCIVASNAAMALWFADAFDPVARFTRRIHPHAFRLIAMTLAAFAVVSCVWLVARLVRRSVVVTVGEGTAFLAAILLFHPYLWVHDLELATFGTLIGHFVQYLALVWLIQNRKYGRRADGSPLQNALSILSAKPLRIVATIAAVGLTAFAASRAMQWIGWRVVYLVLLNSLALIHFYLDGLIWAFRRPFVRQALGPFLIAPASRIVR
jgi:hypothetical protein